MHAACIKTIQACLLQDNMLFRSPIALGITKLSLGRLLWWYPVYPLYRGCVVPTAGLGILDTENPLASAEHW